MPLSNGVREHLDRLPLQQVVEEFAGYVAGRYEILQEGQSKLILLFDKGQMRRAIVEVGLSPAGFEELADTLAPLR